MIFVMMLEEITKLPGYELLDSGDTERLERFGDFVLRRPDPGVLWHKSLPESEWAKANAVFRKRSERTEEDDSDERGSWKINGTVPEKWLLKFAPAGISGGSASAGGKISLPNPEISFYAQLTPFKHTGIFPEQAANWQFIAKNISEYQAGSGVGLEKSSENNSKQPLRFLNLFGYTGVASVMAAKLGAQVTHVDASKPSISWAKENMLASGLPEDAIRWILDDCLKFVKREANRGKVYDAIIMDPPAFGRGAKGEVWKFSEDLPKLLEEIQKIISPNFKFLIINAYAVSVSSLLLKNLLEDFNLPKKTSPWKVDYGELVLKETSPRGRELSTGIFARLY